MKVAWVRGSETIRFTRPHTFFILGVRGSGKSSLLEHIAESYLDQDQIVLDLFGSRDGEGLAWLRSPHVKDQKILLIHGDNVSISSSFDAKNISKLSLSDFRHYNILISSSPLYSSIDDEFFHINHVINLLYKRISYKRLIYMIVRESANLYYSRLRVSPNQLSAKAESTYLIREARHCGIAMGLDTLKYTSVDLDVRSVVDYLILKSQGVLGFPSDMQWLYGYFAPHKMRNMPPQYFCVVTRKGALGLGVFPEVSWHKREKENILRSVGVKVEHGERIDYGENRGVYRTIGDEEHVQIIDDYFQGLSMGKIAKKLNRSAATIHTQIHNHNKSIEKFGYCVKCRRLKGKHEAEKTEKRMLKVSSE